MNIFFNLVFKKSALAMTILALATAFFIYQIQYFQLDASSDSLVLEGDENLRYYQNIRKHYGADDYLIISYSVDDNLFDPAQLTHLGALRDALRKLQPVRQVTTILDVPLFQSPPLSLGDLTHKEIVIDNGNADMKAVPEEFATSPLFANNLVSLDGKTTALLIMLEENERWGELRAKRDRMRLEKSSGKLGKDALRKLEAVERQVRRNSGIESEVRDKTIHTVRETMDPYRDKARLFLGGLPMITADIITYIRNDLVVFGLAVVALMAGVLAFFFRTLRWVLMPIGISLTAALVMTGILAFIGWQVTVISANFFSLLLVMTLSVTVHLVVRFRELAQKNPDWTLERTIEETLRQMFKPCLSTTLTTIVAFVSLIVSDIRPVIDFGWMMALGVTLALVFSFLAFPLLMRLLPKPKITKNPTEARITLPLARFTRRFGGQLIVAVALLMMVAIYGMSTLTVENRFIDYFKKSTEIYQGLSLIDQKLGGTMPLEIVVDYIPSFSGGRIKPSEIYWEDEEFRAEISQIHQFLDGLPESGKVLSIDTLMRMLEAANNHQPPGGFLLSAIKSRIPERAGQVMVDPYISDASGKIRLLARINETNPDLNRNALIQKTENYLAETMRYPRDSFHLTGMLVLYNNMLQSLFDSQIKTIAVVFVMIFLMFLLIFKSWALSALAIFVNILPSMMVLGAMGLLKIPLDLMTITIAAIAIGIGVDNAIHYIHRFKAEFQTDRDFDAAMMRSHASIGLAMFYTAITITLGFLILVLSNFVPSIYFGIFTAVAMVSAVLANLTLLPKLMILLKPKIQ